MTLRCLSPLGGDPRCRLSGVTVLISMLFDPAPDAEGREFIQAYAANDRAQGVHTNLIRYGFALFAPVAYGMVGLVRRRGAWIANLARRLSMPRERLRSYPVSPP
jgi:hypothetical protein